MIGWTSAANTRLHTSWERSGAKRPFSLLLCPQNRTSDWRENITHYTYTHTPTWFIDSLDGSGAKQRGGLFFVISYFVRKR
jgi:hypothetical protein